MKKFIYKNRIPLICVLSVICVVSLGMLGYKLARHYRPDWFRYHASEETLELLEQVGLTFGHLNTTGVFPKDLGLTRKQPRMVLEDVNGGLLVSKGVFIHPVPLNPNYPIKNIDFAQLRQVNGDVTGYLEIENMDVVSYPVYYREGTDYYLKHNRYLEYDIYGELYVEGKISNAHSRTNTIIYGHNMRNGTMFGSLRAYKNAEFFPGHEFFWYYTPKGKYRYQIFSVYETRYDSDTFTWFKEPGQEYTNYLTKMKSQQKYETGVTPDPTDEIITLCTCTSLGGVYRLVLQGRLVYKEE